MAKNVGKLVWDQLNLGISRLFFLVSGIIGILGVNTCTAITFQTHNFTGGNTNITNEPECFPDKLGNGFMGWHQTKLRFIVIVKHTYPDF